MASGRAVLGGFVLIATHLLLSSAFVVIYVSPEGHDGVNCGATLSTPCETFKWAIEAVAAVQIDPAIQIQAFPGVYDARSCNALINRTMFVVGSSAEDTVIDCAGVGRAFYTGIAPLGVYFENLTIMSGLGHDGLAFGAMGGCILAQLTYRDVMPVEPWAEFHRVTFINCTTYSSDSFVDGGGGGLAVTINPANASHATYAGSPLVIVSDCVFLANVAVNDGIGGVSNGGGLLIQVHPALVVGELQIQVLNSNFTYGYVWGDQWGEGGGTALVIDGAILSGDIILDGLIVTNNEADYGGGIYTEHDGLYYNCSMYVASSFAQYNKAHQQGGGLYMEDWATTVESSLLVISGSVFDNNTSAGDGGGMLVSASLATASGELIDNYRQFTYFTHVVLDNSTFTRNFGHGSSSNGGGIAVFDGCDLNLRDSVFTDNSARLYGGGLFLGPGAASLTCFGTSVFANNSVRLGGGAQFSSFASGNMDWSGLHVHMSITAMNQVHAAAAGNVSQSNDTQFTCPVGSLFEDSFNGLFGINGALSVQLGWSDFIRVSTLQFYCELCPAGSYTLSGATSDGQPGVWNNPTCLPCPYGGSCAPGQPITAAPGFWGAPVVIDSNGTQGVEFLQCPEGYCCGRAGDCQSIDGCAGNRHGRLCGSCLPGYGESISSSVCRKASECVDGRWFWPVMVFGLLVAGAVMLRNGEVWCPRKAKPTGKAKLASYFYQMIPLVVIPTKDTGQASTFKRVLDGFFSIFRLQLPGNGSGRGACVIPGLGVSGKISLGYIVPLLVAVAMVVCYYCGVLFGKTDCAHTLRKRYFTPKKKKRSTSPYSASLSAVVEMVPHSTVSGGHSTPVPLLTPSVEASSSPSRASTSAPDAKTGQTVSEKPQLFANRMFHAAKSFRNPLARSSLWANADSFVDLALSDPAPGVVHNVLPLYERVKGAALNWFLFAYSAILAATLRLLSCVHIPGSSGRFLFQDATRSCTSAAWQAPLFIVVTFLVGFAVLLPYGTFRVHRRRIFGRGIHRTLCEQYVPEYYWWESVLIGQRLVLSFLNTFAVSLPVVRLILAALVCLCVTVAHVTLRPMNTNAAQRLQTVLQFSLLVVVLSNVAPAHDVELALTGPSVTSSASTLSIKLLNTLNLLFVYVVPIIAIVTSVPASSWVNPIMVLFR